MGADGMLCIKKFQRQMFEIEGNWRKQTQINIRSRLEWVLPVRHPFCSPKNTTINPQITT